MENLSVDKKNDYNNEPVYFCASCLSLSIMNYTGIVDCYCGHCTSTRNYSREYISMGETLRRKIWS